MIIDRLIILLNEAENLYSYDLIQKIERYAKKFIPRGIKGYTTLLTYYISKVAIERKEVTFEYGKMLSNKRELVVGVKIPKNLENYDDLVETVIVISNIFEETNIEYGGDSLSLIYQETNDYWIGGLGLV